MVTRDIVLLQQNDLLCKSADVIRGSNLPEAYPIKVVFNKWLLNKCTFIFL